MMFIQKLQHSFETCAQLQSSSPNLFRNSVHLMGEFFNKARMANGQHFTIMSTPLLSYLDMLLDSGDCMDLKLFTTQLYLNGNTLRQECPDRVTEIRGKIRLILTTDQTYNTKESKLWLLLAIEIIINKFSFSAEIYNYYKVHLGDHAMAFFQGSHESHETLPDQPVHRNHLNQQNHQRGINVVKPLDAPSNSTQNINLRKGPELRANTLNARFHRNKQLLPEKEAGPSGRDLKSKGGEKNNVKDEREKKNGEYQRKNGGNKKRGQYKGPKTGRNGWSEHDDRCYQNCPW
ncbi:uncharacterized protein LOC126735136 [Anthonomus grandis grandis]|uniref:uncharacterized protein LOC126735136 n=1 Tax=Anthonomus grandis grandis TaxID=2921223 RepID=UPI002165D741|nr:uncharacterized protein LOC126735136 [Anthonomus grandis grandis]